MSKLIVADNVVMSLEITWHLSDALWEMLSKVLTVYDPPKPTGRPRMDQRRALEGMIYRCAIGCQWNEIPKEYGDDISIYRTFRRWQDLGILDILWMILQAKCESLRHLSPLAAEFSA